MRAITRLIGLLLFLPACASPPVINRPLGEDFCLETWHRRLGYWQLWDLDREIYITNQIDEKACVKTTKPLTFRVVVFGKEKRRHCVFRVYPGDSVFIDDREKELSCELRPSDPYRARERIKGKLFTGEAVPEHKPW